MKSPKIILTLWFVGSIVVLNAQTFEWAKCFGSPDGDDEPQSITLDIFGNIYTIGNFQGTLDFDPGVGTAILNSVGSTDIFIQKLDPSGNFLWAKGYGGTNQDHGYSIIVDSLGYVYALGDFKETVDFDPETGTSNISSLGGYDIFVQKMDASGNVLWTKSFGGTANEGSRSLSLDSAGNIYLTGYFFGSVDFDPGVGTAILNSVGSSDIFIQKLDSFGNFLWAKSIGGSGSDSGDEISLDILGNLYVTGLFNGTVDFNSGSGITNLTSTGGHDIFILKLDSLGNFIWAESFGGLNTDMVLSMALDIAGNIHITGKFAGSVDFDPGPGITNLTSTGVNDIFVQKLDSSGTFLWAKSFEGEGSGGLNSAQCIKVDALGNVYTIGTFYETVDFNPGYVNGNHTSMSLSNDVFVHKFDALGNFIWVKLLQGTSGDVGLSLCLDPAGSIFTTGFFYSTADFDPGSGTANLTSLGGKDAFIQKMSQCISTAGIDEQTACGSFTWIDGNTYSMSNNTATHILTNVAGCDSVVTLNLTILPMSSIIVESNFSLPSDQNICNGALAVTLDAGSYNLDVDNNAQLISSTGYGLITDLCPGIHDLTITDDCGNTLSTQFVIPIDSNYVFNNPFIDSLALDSLGLTVTSCEIYYNSIDAAYIDSIWATGNTVNVVWNIVSSNGSFYDTSNYELNNGNGVYWLQLSVFCPFKSLGEYFTVTEAIYFLEGNIINLDLKKLESEMISLYPNPTNDEVMIRNSGGKATLIVYDINGKEIIRAEIIDDYVVSLRNFGEGVYLFDFQSSEGRNVKRIVKN